jgi:glycosyltransferase involved in cell wall biosynthesis
MKKKVVVVGLKGLPAFGGAATVGENIINELKDQYDFTILSVSSHTKLKSGLYNGCKQVVFSNYGKGGINTLLYYLRCAFHCLFHNYDLVHLHHAESGFITPILKIKNKVIVTFHGVFLNKDPKFSGVQNRFFRFSEKLNVKYADEVVSVSKPDADFIYDKYHRNIIYIPNGIKMVDLSTDQVKKEQKQKYIAFAAGRIYTIKGLHLLLQAAKKNKLNTEIRIAGDLDQVPSYKKEILQLSEGMYITFLGLIKEKIKLLTFLAEAELFVFPSLTEAMSIMLLEAVSTKVPIIASDIPSNRAVFNDDEVLFFKNDDSNDLADKLEYAAENKTAMLVKAEKAFDKLLKNNTWTIVSEKYNKLYQNIVN